MLTLDFLAIVSDAFAGAVVRQSQTERIGHFVLGEVACSSLPENLGRFSLILRARPPGSGSLRRNRRDGGIFANPFTTRGFA